SNMIGSGGMGEVYRARDTRLARNVALKILPPHLSTGPEARERFEREARTVAALNHPHICSIFDVGSQDGVDYIVMEFLDGETLAARLERGPLPLETALKVAIEIMDALDKAHRQGVTHRDLKPGNIMLTKTGAKLLDFGLAKLAPPAAQQLASEQPTAKTQSDLTAEGTILGTLQYMAPEQLEGHEADTRSDIFALGTVLYEMLTGKKAFQGKSKASLIAAIIGQQPPPVSNLQTVAPPELDQLLAMCMAKDPNDRWQSAHDVTAQLKWIVERTSPQRLAPPAGVKVQRRQHLTVALVVVLAAIALVSLGTLAYDRFRPVAESAVRFSVPLPEGTTLVPVPVAPWPTVSPDGHYLTFNAVSKGTAMLWLQALDAPVAQPLPGTENGFVPFWSPDSRFIGFFADDKLKKISVSGGLPQ